MSSHRIFLIPLSRSCMCLRRQRNETATAAATARSTHWCLNDGAIHGKHLAPYSSGVVPTEWKDKYRQLEWVVVPDNADDGVMYRMDAKPDVSFQQGKNYMLQKDVLSSNSSKSGTSTCTTGGQTAFGGRSIGRRSLCGTRSSNDSWLPPMQLTTEVGGRDVKW